jgi:hypothetical protein
LIGVLIDDQVKETRDFREHLNARASRAAHCKFALRDKDEKAGDTERKL